jgi:hypothetical protein
MECISHKVGGRMDSEAQKERNPLFLPDFIAKNADFRFPISNIYGCRRSITPHQIN